MKITIKGVEYDFTIGLAALRQLEINTGKAFSQIDEMSPLDVFPQVALATLMARNKDFALTIEDIINEMDDNPEILDTVVDAFYAYMEQWENAADKKKRNKRK